MKRRREALRAAALGASLSLGACDRPADPAPAPPASATAEPVAAASASAATPQATPWYVGRFSAKLIVKKGTITLADKKAQSPAWAADDGTSLVGDATLTLDIADDGTVQGTVEGALGPLSVNGHVDGEHITATLTGPTSARPNVAGLLELTRAEEKITGRLRASGGDSALVREADVVLEKK